MKKLFLFFTAVFFTAISANVLAQDQTTIVNASHTYSVDDNSANSFTYQWSVYNYDVNYLTTTSLTAADGTAYALSNETTADATIVWNTPGSYIVEVEEATDNSCTAIRRYYVLILDLDLEVVTIDTDGTTKITANEKTCNSDAGSIFGSTSSDEHDLNNAMYGLTTMTYKYEISLYTEDGTTADNNDLIGTSFSSANWMFTVSNTTDLPDLSSASVTWAVSGANETTIAGSGTTEITVPAGTSTVTITAEITNIASTEASISDDYILNLSIDPTTVLIDADADDNYTEGEGQESTVKTFSNSAYQITVNPIPNTSKISFQ